MIVESVEIERRFYGQGTEILESVYFRGSRSRREHPIAQKPKQLHEAKDSE